MTTEFKSPLAAHLAAQKTELQEKQNTLRDGLKPLYAERDALVAKIQPLEAELREVNARIKEAEKPLRAIGNDLAVIARAEGARTLTNEGMATGQPETFTPDTPVAEGQSLADVTVREANTGLRVPQPHAPIVVPEPQVK